MKTGVSLNMTKAPPGGLSWVRAVRQPEQAANPKQTENFEQDF